MCGVFGIHSTTRDVARLTYFGLFALQHRGQESAGIAVSDGGRITVVRDMGLVPQVFNSEEKLEALGGNVAIGHTRYSTTGGAHWSNAQPVLHEGAKRRVALGHNGNLTNSAALRDELEADGVALASTSDTEVIAALIAREEGTLVEAVVATMARLQGAFSVVCLSEGRLVAFRDAHGIRPLTLGTVGDDWVVASESCALDLVGARIERDVRAGEIVMLGPGGLASTFGLAPARPAACIFEHVYFARPDTRLNGQEVHRSRVRMGERLADEAPAEADLVMPIPDSGTPAAIGFAKRSGIPFEEGLIKNRYVGRTFIQPDQELRRQGIRLKFNPLDEIAGQRVVIVDDSIVRGNTMRQLVQMLFAGGAEEVHVRISSPQVVSPCFYGIDMAHEDDLVASARPVEEVRRYIGAT
ncbi:MAG: amidophosphoribosyltransferase, partial [Gaiella sp.]